MYRSYRPLLDALARRGLSVADIEEAAKESERTGRSIRDVLVNDSVITEFEMAEALAESHGMGCVDLVGYPIDPVAAGKIPFSLVLRHRVLGIAITDNELVVATSDPDDVVALDDVRAATGMVIRPTVAVRSELRKVIERLKRNDSDLSAMATRRGPRTTPRGRSDVDRRRRTGGQVCELADRAGHSVPGIRPASGTL